LRLGLTLLNGDNKGKRFKIEAQKPCSIGRDSSCTMYLNDKLVSKHHADISYVEGKMTIVDMVSVNGTFVNGQKISRKILNEGDNVTIGVSVFRVTSVDGFPESDSVASISPDDQAINVPALVPDKPRHGGLSPRLAEYIHGIQQIIINSSDNIVRQSLKKLFRILPVTRIAVFNVADDGQLAQGYTVCRQTDGKSANMSHTFALKVLEAKKALLIKDASGLQKSNFSHSIGFQDVHCIIGLPVAIQGRIRVILLGDNLEKPDILTEEHMRIMQFAGKAIEVLYQRDAVSKLDDMTYSLPVCDLCKKVRDDQGYWNQLESFVAERTAVRLSRSCCPECAGKIIKS